MAALTWIEICERASNVNKTALCYSGIKNRQRYILLKCNECGDEKPSKISIIRRCKNCFNNSRRASFEDFIEKARRVHGDRFNYDLVKYVNSNIKVKILCNECNTIFLQKPGNHLSGKKCMVCANNSMRSNAEDFIEKAIQIHSDKYSYDSVKYVNNYTRVKILCNTCKNFFLSTPSNHLSGKKCMVCARNSMRSSTEDFIEKAINVHGDLYNYDLVVYVNSKTKVKILCNICKNIFLQRPDHHCHDGQGCSICNESSGEIKVASFLESRKIAFIRQKTFIGLLCIRELKYDFYLVELNIIVEYDGEAHYKPAFGNTSEEKQANLESCQLRDNIKNEWALTNNIPLLRIPYWDYDRIEELIEAFILENARQQELNQSSLEI
jgi:hypothetical protein